MVIYLLFNKMHKNQTCIFMVASVYHSFLQSQLNSNYGKHGLTLLSAKATLRLQEGKAHRRNEIDTSMTCIHILSKKKHKNTLLPLTKSPTNSRQGEENLACVQTLLISA